MSEIQFWQGDAGCSPSRRLATITIQVESLGLEHADAIRASQIFRGVIAQKAWTSTEEREVRRVEQPIDLGQEFAAEDDWKCWVRLHEQNPAVVTARNPSTL